MKLKLTLMVAVLAVATAAVAATPAQEQAVTNRQAGYKQIGGAFKAINDELKASAPNAKTISANAAKIQALSAQIPGWFPAGSGPESGLKTKAKAEIWTDGAKFATATKALQVESGKLKVAADGGNLDAIRSQVKAVGGSCGGCHKPYRAE